MASRPRALTSTSTAGATAAYVAGQTAKIGLSMGGFYLAAHTGLVLYNQISATSTQNTGTQQLQSQTSSVQQSNPTNSTSNPNNFTLSGFINGEVSSFAQGFTFGTEYAGEFGAAGVALSAAVKTPSILVSGTALPQCSFARRWKELFVSSRPSALAPLPWWCLTCLSCTEPRPGYRLCGRW